ncbi:phosphoribosylglycinamide formyltransferase 2 [Sulfolobus sp. A20]|uniref:formate-dependent phosphoribosylglycinamide formyltransferase n=1 Tax=Sulfolobaceae TaxID=118883 RepID=UPI000845E7AC|nr:MULTISPECIES: formate-dependent phosphoribosylglycinamide formyltransferase [unclassified Sulfolobus]TRM77361.1 formate-dependent phosphoribosylglycinamide formyltransferase [Sulfolobus sp. A20-N-F8]TRM85249.1 formate-dependent phosphoribosylglycinamide formyltransferase [Sulfolobus sp. F3]TRN00657.1 formate-dependent phosphoribosylglycinamide formyltransferase [Sulfolobus sp. F1]TRN04218.1 formate-dependent phosphoribosylglycinamide formyltransferase [Sulfolobus sp. E1]AOL16280.1 phosphori
MEIGTPLFEGAKKVLLLGSGELGKEMVIEAQRMGIETIAVDRYGLAPAMHVAHRKYVIDMLNPNAIKAIVKREEPDAIIAEIEAINTDALIELENSGYKVAPNANAVKVCMNRIELRRLASEKLKLPTTKYAFAENEEEVKKACKDIGFPCLIKPEMSSSGHGHVLVEREEDVEKAYKESISHARGKSRKVIVEEYVKINTELTVLTYRYYSSSGNIVTKTIEPIEHKRPSYYYVESWHPSTVPQNVKEKSREIAYKIVEELGGFGIYGVEIIVTEDRVLFSEVAPRPHDTGLVTLASSDINEFQIHIRSALGLPTPDVKLVSPAAAHVILAPRDDIWGPKYINVEKALEISGVQIRLFGKPVTYDKRRMGLVLATGNSVEDALEKVRKASSIILIK